MRNYHHTRLAQVFRFYIGKCNEMRSCVEHE
jgi:hypothetical protein